MFGLFILTIHIFSVRVAITSNYDVFLFGNEFLKTKYRIVI